MYFKERRLEVLADAEAGLGTKAIAQKFGCSPSWVRRVKQEYREHGKTAPKTTRNRIPNWQPLSEDIVRLTGEYPDLTLAELKERLGTDLSLATLCNALKALRLSFKKKSDELPNKTGKTSGNNALAGD